MKAALASGMALCLVACATMEPRSGDAGGTTGALFVAGKFGNTLTRIDLATGQKTARVDSCKNPHELATSPDSNHVALACYGGTAVEIFRTSDLARVKRIELGENARPHGIVWHPNGDLYATAEGRRSIFWLRRPLSEEPEAFEFATNREGSHMLVVSPDARHAWTTDLGAKTVSRIDLITRRAPQSVEVGLEPEGLALAPDGETLWVSARKSNKAFALDPETLEVEKEVAVGGFPLRIAIRPQGDVAVTSDLDDSALSVVDLATATKTRTITLGDRANAQKRFQVTVIWSPDGRRLYVAETGTDSIAEVDYASGKVLRRLEGGDGGDGLAIIGKSGG